MNLDVRKERLQVVSVLCVGRCRVNDTPVDPGGEVPLSFSLLFHLIIVFGMVASSPRCRTFPDELLKQSICGSPLEFHVIKN